MILVINSGSSSVKIALVEEKTGHLQAENMAECLGEKETAIHQLLKQLPQEYTGAITAVGHRVVHGGERFVKPTLLDEDVLADIAAISHLAPLHNPANLIGISVAMKHFPDLPHIAVFDTAFHHNMPPHAYLYAVPHDWYKKYGVRRYGFHGSSHHYVAKKAAACLNRPLESCRLLTAHLGNGCSAAAIAGGTCVDTTMGMTPLEGLVMGTRCGDVDPGLHEFIANQTDYSLSDITAMLNHDSGLLGLSGLSHDMRIVLKAAHEGHQAALLAIDVFCYRLAKSLAGLAVALGSIDAIVFTGGIGEHAHEIRTKTIKNLSVFGALIDKNKNEHDGKTSACFIHDSASTMAILVVATNEESMIAHHVCARLSSQRLIH